MDKNQIIENIEAIYDKYKIPSNLRNHMKLVAKVANYICREWKSQEVLDSELVEATCLVHDLGNIIRFNSDSLVKLQQGQPEINWYELKESMLKKYGKKDKQATKQMLKEIDAPDEVINMITNQVLNNKEFDINSLNPELKIFIYSDFRVGPKGIITLKERLTEINTRFLKNKRHGTKDLFVQYPQVVKNVKTLEKDITKYTNAENLNLPALKRLR